MCRSLICYQSYFNEREATEVDQAQEFQLVYCSRQFATSRPGYVQLLRIFSKNKPSHFVKIHEYVI